MGKSVQSIYSVWPVCKQITSVCSVINNGQMTNFCLHNEQTVNGLCKIARASVFRLMSPCPCSMSPCLRVSMSPCLHVSMYPCLNLHVSVCPEFLKRKMELTEKGNFRLFSANGKRNQQSFISLLQNTEMESGHLFSSVGRQ